MSNALPAPDARVFFRDVKPYDVPGSLNDLRGPSSGLLQLPHHVHWGPDRRIDLDVAGDRLSGYQAVISEGDAKDQQDLLNATILRREWSALVLAPRLRLLWESALPELVDAPA